MGSTSRMQRSSRRYFPNGFILPRYLDKLVANVRNCSMAPIIYGPEGLHIAKLLYEETLREMTFAGVQDFLERL